MLCVPNRMVNLDLQYGVKAQSYNSILNTFLDKREEYSDTFASRTHGVVGSGHPGRTVSEDIHTFPRFTHVLYQSMKEAQLFYRSHDLSSISGVLESVFFCVTVLWNENQQHYYRKHASAMATRFP